MRCLTGPVVALLVCAGLAARADEPAEISIREVLVLNAGGRGGRSAIPSDPIQARIVIGAWNSPKEGDLITLPDGGERRWQRVEAGEDGAISHPALRGGYAYASIELETGRVMMLEASGHEMVYVNGEPRVGDPYRHGFVRLPVPLKQGKNEFLFHVGRGELRAKLVKPKADVFIDTSDSTLPDLVDERPVEASVVVINATGEWLKGLYRLHAKFGDQVSKTYLFHYPYASSKQFFAVRVPPGVREGAHDVELMIQRDDDEHEVVVDRARITLNAVSPRQPHKRTFLSKLDSGLQYYGVVPPVADSMGRDGRKPGLILSLHGAGVEAIGQARVYAPKNNAYVITPTNRRPYGFDWEDWGRLDALEVLHEAQKAFDTDPKRTWLTGHSMGGHGTWHLGVTYPDRFAAIAPSAGWVSMFSYAGARRTEGKDPIEALLQRCANPSDTLSLLQNVSPLGVYVLHGDHDDNVPVGQARVMRKALAEFHPDFGYYERPGAGHWWGNECCDWPPLIGFLERHELPSLDAVRRIDFRTAHPGVASRCHWATIEAQGKPFEWSDVHLWYVPGERRVEGTTQNVARLSLDLDGLKGDGPLHLLLDGVSLDRVPAANADRRLWLEHDGDHWSVGNRPDVLSKTPARSGPFRDVFRNKVVFVVATHGTPEENAWSLAKARYDAETFWYRGNGSIDVIPDHQFDEAIKLQPDTNVVVYGHARMNGVWDKLLGDSPVQVDRGVLRIGDKRLEGPEQGCLMIRPRPTQTTGCVGVVAGTGMAGMRALDRLPYFTSGVAYPDWIVIGADAWESGVAGVRAAGFFGNDWGLDSGEVQIRRP